MKTYAVPCRGYVGAVVAGVGHGTCSSRTAARSASGGVPSGVCGESALADLVMPASGWHTRLFGAWRAQTGYAVSTVHDQDE